jgi:hypothetical protein
MESTSIESSMSIRCRRGWILVSIGILANLIICGKIGNLIIAFKLKNPQL